MVRRKFRKSLEPLPDAVGRQLKLALCCHEFKDDGQKAEKLTISTRQLHFFFETSFREQGQKQDRETYDKNNQYVYRRENQKAKNG